MARRSRVANVTGDRVQKSAKSAVLISIETLSYTTQIENQSEGLDRPLCRIMYKVRPTEKSTKRKDRVKSHPEKEYRAKGVETDRAETGNHIPSRPVGIRKG